jgi:hypothetical protein
MWTRRSVLVVLLAVAIAGAAVVLVAQVEVRPPIEQRRAHH